MNATGVNDMNTQRWVPARGIGWTDTNEYRGSGQSADGMAERQGDAPLGPVTGTKPVL